MQRPSSRPAPTEIRCIEEIPNDVGEQEVFRLTVEVVQITERATSEGNPVWFVLCEDQAEIRFDISVFESQKRKILLEEGTTQTVDVRIPKPPHTSYRLA